MEKDYCLIFVGNTQMGLISLKETLEGWKSKKMKPEAESKAMLVGIVQS
jgi:hypothetical protein